MTSLRSKLIRLAHEKPELRPHLLPLLKTAVGSFMDTRGLPPSLKAALKSVGFNRPNVKVEPSTTYTVQGFAEEGYRNFAVAVDLVTGRIKVEYGSWGGANPYEHRQVDLDTKKYPLPMNGAVIIGTEGGTHSTHATIYVHPDNLQKLLPAGDESPLSPEELSALNIIGGIISSYRREEFSRAGLGKYGPDNPYVKSLVAKGLIKVTANGGIGITTAGKNRRT